MVDQSDTDQSEKGETAGESLGWAVGHQANIFTLKGKREIKIKVIHIVTSSERLFGSTNSYAGIPPGGHSAFHRSFQTVVSPSRLMITAREVKETQKRRK